MLLRRFFGALLVDGGEHDHSLKLLERHAIFAELNGEVVEELGIGRRIADYAEVVGRVDDAGAEVPLPYAINPDPGGDGARDDVVCQIEPSTSIAVRLLVGRSEDSDEGAWNYFAVVVGVAAYVQRDVDRFRF